MGTWGVGRQVGRLAARGAPLESRTSLLATQPTGPPTLPVTMPGEKPANLVYSSKILRG